MKLAQLIFLVREHEAGEVNSPGQDLCVAGNHVLGGEVVMEGPRDVGVGTGPCCPPCRDSTMVLHECGPVTYAHSVAGVLLLT